MNGKTAVIAFTRRGCQLGTLLAQGLNAALWTPERYAEEYSATPYTTLSDWAKAQFATCNGLIFVSATGIAVRAIAPHVRDKRTDPAVISVDEKGRFVVPLLSGHVGGANALARQVAKLTGGTAVISTATDVNGRFAVDVWAKEQHLTIRNWSMAKAVSAALLDGQTVGFASQVPWSGLLPEGVTESPCTLGIFIGTDEIGSPFPQTLHLVPNDLILGLGCKRGTTSAHLSEVVSSLLKAHGLDPHRVRAVATIDLKRDEEGLLTYCRQQGWPLTCYSAEVLQAVPGTFTPSAFVTSVTGVDNVCERAAVCAGGTIQIPKQAKMGVTLAVAQLPFAVSFEEIR